MALADMVPADAIDLITVLEELVRGHRMARNKGIAVEVTVGLKNESEMGDLVRLAVATIGMIADINKMSDTEVQFMFIGMRAAERARQ